MNKRIYNRLLKIAHNEYKMINVNSGIGLNNNKCHLNVLNSNYKRIAIVLCFGKGHNEVIVHFINKNYNEEYVDDTLGQIAFTFHTFLIEEFDKSDVINDLPIVIEKLNYYKSYLFKQLNLMDRIIYNKNII